MERSYKFNNITLINIIIGNNYYWARGVYISEVEHKFSMYKVLSSTNPQNKKKINKQDSLLIT